VPVNSKAQISRKVEGVGKSSFSVSESAPPSWRPSSGETIIDRDRFGGRDRTERMQPSEDQTRRRIEQADRAACDAERMNRRGCHRIQFPFSKIHPPPH